MKFFLTATFIIMLTGIIRAQSLNKFGHIIDSSLSQSAMPIKKINHRDFYQLKSDVLIEGNSFFEIENAYLTTVTTYENMPTWIYVYNKNGKRLFSSEEYQVVNLKTSSNKLYAAFFCKGFIKVLNLKSFKFTLFPACSAVFGVDDQGNVVSEKESLLVRYKDKDFFLKESPLDVLCFNKDIYISTRRGIYKIDSDLILTNILNIKEGIVFEIRIVTNQLFYVKRTRKNGEFVFELCKLNEEITKFKKDTVSLKIGEGYKDYRVFSSQSNTNHDSIPWVYHSNGTNGFPVGNSYGEIQDYGGNPYLHPGVDMLGSPNQEVYSVKDGIVKAILTTGGAIYWRMAIAYNNESVETPGYLYAHLDQTSIPFIVGDTVYKDDFIGTVVPWPVNGFDHIHFSRIKDEGATWTGSWWTFNNVLPDITNQTDTSKPVFQDTRPGEKFSFRDLNGNYQDPSNLHDSVRIISKFYDHINSNWDVDVCSIRYSLINANNQQVIFDTASYNFDFPIDTYFSNNYTFNVLYTIYNRDSSFECHSVGNYNTRDFYHIISNSLGNDTVKSTDRLHLFNTALYGDGNYYLKITASDCNGNTTSDSMLISIQNLTSAGSFNVPDLMEIFPVPAKESLTIKWNGYAKISYTVVNAIGQVVYNGVLLNDHSILDLRSLNLSKGIYTLRLQHQSKIVNAKFLVE